MARPRSNEPKEQSRRGRTARRKWLLICLGAVVVGWLIWVTVEDLSPIDLRVQASRAAAIGYGTFHPVNGSSRIMIDEVWKQAASGSSLSVGTIVYTPSADGGSWRPDEFIVFFGRAGLFGSGRLQSNAVVAVYKGRVATDDMPVAEAKALCVAPKT